MIEQLDVAVIGAGFAGLATGAALRARGVRHLAILEQGDDVGHFWSQTYDRLHLHSPWHDLPDDGGASANYPMFKSRDDLVGYFRGYAQRHALGDSLRFGQRVLHVEQEGAGWRIETTRGECRVRQLAIATAINRAPHEPEFPGRDAFCGRALHSARYRNAREFGGQRVLVVGSGNSAAEIALDLVQGGAASVSMWVRGARHFIRLRTMRRVYRLFRALGQLSPAKLDARHRISWGTPEFDAAVAPLDQLTNRLSVDLGRFGIRRPEQAPSRETFTKGRIPVYDVGTLDEIRRGRIRVIDGNARPLECFEADGMRIGGERERFDAVILATGFLPRLEEFVVDADRLLGPVRWFARAPLTDGRCRSSVVSSLWFPGFDVTPIGGLSLGRWGFEVGERIAAAL